MNSDRYITLIRLSFFLLISFMLLVGVVLIATDSNQTAPNDSSVSEVNSAIICKPLDVNGDGKLTLVDFSEFAKVYGKVCTEKQDDSEVVNPTGTISVTYNLRAKDVPQGSNAVSLDVAVSNATITSFTIAENEGWIAPLGTCVSNNTTQQFTASKVCVAVAKTDPLSEGDLMGTMVLEYDPDDVPVIETTNSNVYSDGLVDVVASGELDSLATEVTRQDQQISYVLKTSGIVATDTFNAYNADLKITGARVVKFEPNTSLPTVGGFLGSCNPGDSTTTYTQDRVCVSLSKNTSIISGETIGTIVLEFASNENIVIEATEDNYYSNGVTSKRVFGVLNVYTPAQIVLNCGNQDIDGNNKIDIKDFASFAKKWGPTKTCIIN